MDTYQDSETRKLTLCGFLKVSNTKASLLLVWNQTKVPGQRQILSLCPCSMRSTESFGKDIASLAYCKAHKGNEPSEEKSRKFGNFAHKTMEILLLVTIMAHIFAHKYGHFTYP